MKNGKALGKRLLFLPLPLILPLDLVAGGLLIHAFLANWEGTPTAYAAFTLSAYTLVVSCAALPRLHRLALLLRAQPPVHRFLSDYAFRTHTMLRVGLLLNLAFAAFKLCTGAVYASYWLAALGVYYAVLALIRFLLLRRLTGTPAQASSPASRHRACRTTGVMLLVLGVVMSAIIFQVVRDNQTFRYPGSIIYAFGAYAFYKIILAAVNLIRRRGRDDPLLAAARCLSLATAMVSVFSLQTAMLSTFEAEQPAFRLTANAASGTAVCMGFLLIAVTMIVRSTRAIRALQS